MRSPLGVIVVVVAFAACQDPAPFGDPACPEFACQGDGDCLQGFQCVEGACAIPVSCGQMSDCPQDGIPDGWSDCLWTGCACYAGPRPQPPPPPPPSPSCGGAITCAAKPPACGAGEVPAILDGCYTGTCLAIAACDVAPACDALSHEADCLARHDCTAEYEGLGCVDPSGQQCTPGDASCTCASFEFASCVAGG